MDISLEKIDIIRDRTGVSYKEAKDALEMKAGSVVDALIQIEDDGSKKWTEAISVKGSEAIDKVRDIVKSGNANRIRVKKDNYVILDIPVTAGAISAIIIPQLTAVATAVALLSRCTLEVDRPNKQTIHVNDVVADAVTDVADRMKDKLKCTANDMKMGNNEPIFNQEGKPEESLFMPQ